MFNYAGEFSMLVWTPGGRSFCGSGQSCEDDHIIIIMFRLCVEL